LQENNLQFITERERSHILQIEISEISLSFSDNTLILISESTPLLIKIAQKQ